MSKIIALAFHLGETWQIDFAAKDSKGATLPLPLGSIAAIRIHDPTGVTTYLTSSTDDGSGSAVISDPVNGLGTFTVTPAMQATAAIAVGNYKYEWRVVTLTMTSVQAEGRFTVQPSLFAAGA